MHLYENMSRQNESVASHRNRHRGVAGVAQGCCRSLEKAKCEQKTQIGVVLINNFPYN